MDRLKLASIYENIGMILEQMNKFGKSLEYHHKCLELQMELFKYNDNRIMTTHENIIRINGKISK